MSVQVITLFAAREIIENQLPVDICFWNKNGEIIEAKQIVCTSSYFHENTFTFKWPNGQFRKVCAWHIHQVNGVEVCI